MRMREKGNESTETEDILTCPLSHPLKVQQANSTLPLTLTFKIPVIIVKDILYKFIYIYTFFINILLFFGEKYA